VSLVDEGSAGVARKKGSIGTRTAESIRNAGVNLIYVHGFEAMSMRQLASEVGIQPSSLYNYFPNKQDLLFGIMRDYMTELLERAEAGLAPETEAPAARLRRFVDFHVRHHIARNRQIRIVNLELRSLDEQNRAEVIALRDAYEKRLDSILLAGQRSGDFKVQDVRVTTFAIIAMLTGIAAWWREQGRLSVDELVTIHEALVFQGIASK
jgi:AcrR family transcriptional regulator